jgi:predicted secreted hydrolase
MSRGRRAAVGAAIALAAAAAIGSFALRAAGPGAAAHLPRASIAVSEALGGGDLTGFERALAPRLFAFPEDHGPHPRLRTEGWY